MQIIDAHAHIFPDKIAAKAAVNIGGFYDLYMRYDGTLKSLKEIGRRAGVDKFVVYSVAVVPEQVVSINNFIAQTAEENPELIGFASLHPDMPDPEAEIDRVTEKGLRGIKLHPDFQKFAVDSPEAARLFSVIEGRLPVIIHAGDIRYNYSNPRRIAAMLDNFPNLDIICAHFGGYSEWDEAAEYLSGRRLWVDTSSSLAIISKEKALELINLFGEDYVVFGTDYPMWDAEDELAALRGLGLSEAALEKILWKNISTLLGIR